MIFFLVHLDSFLTVISLKDSDKGTTINDLGVGSENQGKKIKGPSLGKESQRPSSMKKKNQKGLPEVTKIISDIFSAAQIINGQPLRYRNLDLMLMNLSWHIDTLRLSLSFARHRITIPH